MLLHDFHMTPTQARYQVPLAEAWALKSWMAEHNPWCKLVTATDGYVAQEVDRILTGPLNRRKDAKKP